LLDQAAAEALRLQVGVDVDHAGHDAEARAVDLAVDPAGIGRIDMDDPVAVERHVDVVAEIVLAEMAVPGDRPARLADAADGHRPLPSGAVRQRAARRSCRAIPAPRSAPAPRG